MKINCTPDEFADVCILFLLDCMSNPDLMVKQSSPRLKLVSDKLKGMGFKSIFMQYFFAAQPRVRQQYGYIRNIFAKKTSDSQTIYISQDKVYVDKAKKKEGKEDKKKTSMIRKVIQLAMKMVNSGVDPNPAALALLQEKVIHILEKEGDI